MSINRTWWGDDDPTRRRVTKFAEQDLRGIKFEYEQAAEPEVGRGLRTTHHHTRYIIWGQGYSRLLQQVL